MTTKLFKTYAAILCLLLPLIASGGAGAQRDERSRKEVFNPSGSFFSVGSDGNDQTPLDGEIVQSVSLNLSKGGSGWGVYMEAWLKGSKPSRSEFPSTLTKVTPDRLVFTTRTVKGISFKFTGEFKYHGNFENHFYQRGDFIALEGTLTKYMRGVASGSQKITFKYQHQPENP